MRSFPRYCFIIIFADDSAFVPGSGGGPCPVLTAVRHTLKSLLVRSGAGGGYGDSGNPDQPCPYIFNIQTVSTLFYSGKPMISLIYVNNDII